MWGALLGAATGAGGGAGAGLPSSSASSSTGEQTQNIGFTGGNISFGTSNNNQLLILGGLMLVGLFMFSGKRK